VDSIHIVQQLKGNPAKVQELVKIAGEIKEKVAVAEASNPNNPPDQGITFQETVKKHNELIDEMNKFTSMGLPIGWSDTPNFSDPMKWLGWFITALAGTLGAPFWFDAISKLFAIRGAGKRPEETTSPAAPSVSVQVSTPATASSTNPQDTPLNDYEASRLNGDDIEGLQRALGMPAAKIDGRLSEELRQLLREWQRVNGKIATGQFDESTVLALLYPENKGN
jgi:hypothetical protein